MAAPAAREARWPLYPDLAGKTAVVTGGSRGLGAEACRALAANGVRVAVGGRDAGAIGDVVDELLAMGADAVAAPADCTSADALRRARDRAQAALGPIEIVLAFAGGGRRPQPISDIPLAEWRADVDGNLTATFLTIQTFLLDLTRQVAHGAAAHGVRANCLAPSTVLNERMRDLLSPERVAARMDHRHHAGRRGRPGDAVAADRRAATCVFAAGAPRSRGRFRCRAPRLLPGSGSDARKCRDEIGEDLGDDARVGG